MAMQTGNISAIVNAGRTASLKRPKAPESVATTTPEPVRLTNNREADTQIRTGFGENTLSPSGAALRTIESNLARARKIIPSVEQLRAEFTARRAEQESAREEQIEAPQQAGAEAPQQQERTVAPQTEPRELRAYRQAPETQPARTTNAPAAPQGPRTAPDAPATAAAAAAAAAAAQPPPAQTANRAAAQAPDPAAGMTTNRLNLLV